MTIDARGFDTDTLLPAPSSALVDVARARTGGRALLAFSGRDSLACWCVLRDAGFEVVPYWCYTVPGLSYDDQMLDYYEHQFDTHIARFPHPGMYANWIAGAWLPPRESAILYSCGFLPFDFAYIEDILAREQGMDADTYLCSVGIRAADNLERLRMIRQMGVLGVKQRKFWYTVWDWKTQDVRDCLRRHGLKLSRSYAHFGSTGDGIDYVFLRYLKDNLPEDYQRVLDVFPLAEAELFRYEQVK